MKIKSLLLGSAAALVAVSGAQAADPVMVEAEPVEYVRVCDAYGAGYFYIPGTETCLKFSGQVRFTVYGYHRHEDTSVHDHWGKGRAKLSIDAKNETEWGTLSSNITYLQDLNSQSYTDVFSSGLSVGKDVGLDKALITLGGLRLGYATQLFESIGGGIYGAIADGYYGGSKGMFIDYTYSADGLALTAGLDLTANSGVVGQPDMYVGATFSGGMGSVYGALCV